MNIDASRVATGVGAAIVAARAAVVRIRCGGRLATVAHTRVAIGEAADASVTACPRGAASRRVGNGATLTEADAAIVDVILNIGASAVAAGVAARTCASA